MVRFGMVCALAVACAITARALDITRFDGNYWSRAPATDNRVILQRKPVYTVLLTERVRTDIFELPVVCKFRITGKSPAFTFRGEGVWNLGPMPVSARIFFTDTDGVYSNIASSQQPNRYWWSTQVVIIGPTGTGEYTLSTTIRPENFTNGIGQSNPERFEAAAHNVRQVGISFCGGWYYDVGLATTTSRQAEIVFENIDFGFPDFIESFSE